MTDMAGTVEWFLQCSGLFPLHNSFVRPLDIFILRRLLALTGLNFMWISECPSIIAHLFILPSTELLHFHLTHSHTILPINWLLGNMVLWMECIFVSVCSGLETLRAKNTLAAACFPRTAQISSSLCCPSDLNLHWLWFLALFSHVFMLW